jgi:uncharacterized Zn finger protein
MTVTQLDRGARIGRENVESKGRRYLTEGRVRVIYVDGDVVRAVVRGGGALYEVTYEPGFGWSCDCPARSRCAHRVALELITSPMTRQPVGSSSR